MPPFYTKPFSAALSRRHFVPGLAAGRGFAVTLGWLQAGVNPAPFKGPEVLSGPEIELDIAPSQLNFTGVIRTATSIDGSVHALTWAYRGSRPTGLNWT